MFAAENGLKSDPRLQGISEAIRVVPHFPKQGLNSSLVFFFGVWLFNYFCCCGCCLTGIMFQDITTLLLDHKAFKDTVDIFVDRYRGMNISVVAGVEARGFVFGPAIALAIGAKFVPLRKPRKLPGEVISEAYELEYGTDCLEIHVGAVQSGERAIVIDDLVATGGTLSAAIRLLERVGAEVIECACVIGVREVKGQCRLNGKPLYILVEPRQIDNCC
ncbi:ADENINE PHOSPHORIBOSYLTRANSFERASE 5-LIKE ISOFORM X1 [Salix viminalis]|uniref:adenine phosphoribosyltransferase n=1 Tax=Salix viminalis TaxID=40686 RepID=A0A9Q0V7R5_SALVM|nr:ADENINE PHOSPHORIBOSYLTRANSFERASE 5-LIKE ISOFORM X1 [Salix viminalis]